MILQDFVLFFICRSWHLLLFPLKRMRHFWVRPYLSRLIISFCKLCFTIAWWSLLCLDFLKLVVVFLRTLALSSSHERLALFEHLLSLLTKLDGLLSWTRLDGLCANLALCMLDWTYSIQTFTFFLNRVIWSWVCRHLSKACLFSFFLNEMIRTGHCRRFTRLVLFLPFFKVG